MDEKAEGAKLLQECFNFLCNHFGPYKQGEPKPVYTRSVYDEGTDETTITLHPFMEFTSSGVGLNDQGKRTTHTDARGAVLAWFSHILWYLSDKPSSQIIWRIIPELDCHTYGHWQVYARFVAVPR